MRGSRVAGFFAVGAISLPFLTSSTSAVAASPRAAPAIGMQLAELVGSDTVAGDYFGSSVTISGTTAVVGAGYHAKIAGRAYVFTKTGAGWKQTAELKGSDTVAGDGFGDSVGLSGTTAVVGAEGHAKVHWSGVRVHQDGNRLEAGRRTGGLRHSRRRHLRLVGGDFWHDHRRGCTGPRRGWSGVCVHQDGGRLETGRRTGWLRNSRRRLRQLRLPGGDLGHGHRRECSRPR